MKILQLILLLSILCFSRDNPFVPVEDISKSTNVAPKNSNFQQKDFSLPDSARILKKVEVYYQNLNGSISKQVVDIDKKIDWHDEFTIKYKNSKIKTLPTTIKTKTKIKKQAIVKKDDIKIYSYKGFISFKVAGKSIKILTKDSKIRDFSVDKPYKIIVDFRRDSNFLTKTFHIDKPPFVSVVLGNHDKYYRVAIWLDGQYIYSLKREKGDYIITLK